MSLRHSVARAIYGVARDRAPKLRGRRRVAHLASRWLASERPLRVEAYGLKFSLDLTDHVEEQIFWEDYDRHILDWWRDAVRPEMVVLDVGANVGLYSLLAAARGATVVAFEPNPVTRERLETNVALNRFGTRITVRSEAVSDVAGTAKLYADVNEGGRDANAGVSSLSPKNAGGRASDVTVTTLDAVVSELGLSRVDWIKMDIQGAELAALRGATATFAMRPKVVLEVEPKAALNMGWTPSDLRELLRSHGYGMKPLDDMNFLAEPSA